MSKTLKPSFSKLDQAVPGLGNLCLGIDPETQSMPEFMKTGDIATKLYDWTEQLLTVAKPFVASVKFQSAFFEAYGPQGVEVLRESVRNAKKSGFFTILDAKRGDISSTMTAYGKMAFEIMQADAMTVVPYMGTSVLGALEPWLLEGSCVYVVLLSSNSDGQVLQQFSGRDLAYYEHVFKTVEVFAKLRGWEDRVGYVVGAQNISSGMSLEKVIEKPLLIPGIGAQGASVDTAIKNCLRVQRRSLVAISRGITIPKFQSNENDLILKYGKEFNWNLEKNYFAVIKERLEKYVQLLSPS